MADRKAGQVARRIFYRLWQFFQVVSARSLSPKDWDCISAALTPSELALFQSLSASDRRHAYRVMQTLLAGGHRNPDLLAAALLHDVGKALVRLSWWDRAVAVLGPVLLPERVKEWAQGDLDGWRKPFVVWANHPEWGASLAHQAGSRPLTVALIRRHQVVSDVPARDAPVEEGLLRLLQKADSAS